MKKTRQTRIFGYLFSVHTEYCSFSDLKPTSVLRSAGNHFYVVLGPTDSSGRLCSADHLLAYSF